MGTNVLGAQYHQELLLTIATLALLWLCYSSLLHALTRCCCV